MFFLQADTAEQIDSTLVNQGQKMAEALQSAAHGDTSELSAGIQQLITMGIEAGKSILVALIIYTVGRFIVKLIKKLLNSMMERRHMEPSIQSFLSSFVNILLNVLLIITVASALGINTTSFAALLASVGVAVGMALSGNLQNFAGGIIILLFKPYRVGDFIEAQGASGVVKEIQIFHTIILTPDNKQIHVPNGALSSGNLTNYSTMPLRRVDLTVGVEYGEDVDKVRRVLLDIFSKDARILQDPAPFIGLGELADSSVNLTLRVWTKGEDYWGVYFDTQETIYKVFGQEGIGFPYPHLTIDQA